MTEAPGDPLSPALAIPRHVWTADRWARLLAGGSIVLCLAAAWLLGGESSPGQVLLLLAALIGLEQVITALAGWCPFHQLMRRLGVKDREQVFVDLQMLRKSESVRAPATLLS